ncbi:glycosyltransferase family 4 protein [Qipengyuania atrilutea]|uniref:Glycosyltransferase family 1 protein n=1 Tax=Qipengyuania atrilutea TaxID=2744473 RepID=A0A850H350_9SPHN|nr:glycosyltransferase family 1 protein [Actirhodobacter atriluteus]NVD44997.1 glycosyltransferase family 1 protein [Actirhodobacter atriluteus]
MRICFVTDAWKPQVNGVVRTLEATRRVLENRGHLVDIISPDRFRSAPCPSYPEIRLALAGEKRVGPMIERFRPQALHIATEGPLGFAARRWAKRSGMPFTSAFHTHFPQYLSKRTRLNEGFFWPALRRFHAASSSVLCATDSMKRELARRGIVHTSDWGRGVDLAAFGPDGPPDAAILALAGGKPKLLFVGRVAVEKNLKAFLSLDIDAAKFVVGDGPQRRELMRAFPDAHFLGSRTGEALAAAYRTADCFVFPSMTDTFGLVLIEALASGTPVAAYDATGPRDILTNEVGAIGPDLTANVKRALAIDPAACVAHAKRFSWEAATDLFENALVPFGPAMAARAMETA